MKSTPIRILSFAVAFILLVLALSAVQGRMNGIRYDKHLTDADPLENAPPLVAFTSVALGGFRGLARAKKNPAGRMNRSAGHLIGGWP